MKKATALYFLNQNLITFREETLPDLKKDQVLIRTKYSAISAGTEMLIYRGLIPQNLPADTSIPALTGQLKYPLKYGYSLVGKITGVASNLDRQLLGKWVFVFHPHQTEVVANIKDIFLIPHQISPAAALFFPNLETAVSLVMDARPVIGEKIVLFGQGVVGLLTTALLARIPYVRLIAIDPIKKRLAFSHKFGAEQALNPRGKNYHKSLNRLLNLNSSSRSETAAADLIFELSGNPEALNSALQLAGYQGRIVIGSWYGNKPVSIDLGTCFHRNRLQLISSQVSTIDPAFRGRWSKQRRFELVWQMLREIKPEVLITHGIPFRKAAAAYRLIDENPAEVIQVILTY
jgi:2-desacetyl-2-hydroxyethyl bacteriochlorophyllide A dehydrogenase